MNPIELIRKMGNLPIKKPKKKKLQKEKKK